MLVKDVRKEILIEARLIQRVMNAGGVAEKVEAIGSRGFFDRLVVLPGGRVVFCEIKRPKGGVVSAHQRARHATYKNLGAEVALISCEADIDWVLCPQKKSLRRR